jgi:hypothetical protein
MKNSTKSTIVNDIKQLNSYTLESMLDVFNTTERKLTEDELAFYAELYKELESRKENPRFDHGGNIAQQNKDMLNNQAREVDHHIDELNNVLKNKVDVEPWVVAKMERATTDLSDITHYLDGEQKKEYSKPIYAEGGNVKIGGTIRLKNDLPYLASLDSLKGKDLKVKDIKHIYFASGSKLFYVVNHDGHEHEINEDFIEHKDKMASGGVIGKDITFNKWDETRNGTILELTDDGQYVVSSGAGSTLVSPEDVISFNEPKAKAKRFGFFEDGGGVDDDFVIFSVDDDALDTLLFDNHRSELDYEDIHGDSYYKLNRRDFDSFIDYADSIGFDVDYENNEDAVIYVVNPRMSEGGGVGKEKFNLSFNYNPGNISNKDVEKIVEQYTKNWNHNNDFDEVSFYVSNLTKDKADELRRELKMEDVYNIEIEKSRYEDGGGVGENKTFDSFKEFKSFNKKAWDSLIDVWEDASRTSRELARRDLNENVGWTYQIKLINGKIYFQNIESLETFEYNESNQYWDDINYEKVGEFTLFAHGGMTEHGLDRGDTIVFNSGDEVMVIDKKDEQHLVDLDKGMRYEGGGSIQIGDKVKARKEYGGKSGVVVDKIGSFVVVENSKGVSESYHESDLIKKMVNGGGVDQVKYVVVRSGGSIGESKGSFDRSNNKLIEIFDNENAEEEAKNFAKRMNSTLSPGEKKYYKIKYIAKIYNPNQFTVIGSEESNKMVKGGYLEGREEYEGYNYKIWYNPNKRMYSVSDEIGVFKGDNNYFEKYDQAKEHAEISIRSILSDKDDKMANGGGVDSYKIGDVLEFKDGEAWKVVKVKSNLDKLVIKPYNELAKKQNVSIEIDIDLDYLNKNLKDKMSNGGGVSEIEIKIWDEMNSNKRFHILDYHFPRGISKSKKQEYSMMKFNDLPFKIKNTIVIEEKYANGGGVGEQDKLETVLDNIFNGDYDEEEVDSLNVSQEMKDRINELSNLYSELNDAINDDDTKLENKLQKKVDKEYNYIIENAYKNKMANGGGIRKAPFKLGDMVYSYQNPNHKMRVSFIEDRGIIDGVDYGWNIKVALKTDSDGNYNPKGTYSKSSKWMSQNSVSKTKKEKYTTGGSMTGWKHKK